MSGGIDLIIFDCDGVLVDSEGLSAGVLLDLLANHGVAADFDYFCVNFLGRSFPTVAEDIRRSFNVALPPTFETDYRRHLLAAFEEGLQPTPGMVGVLEALELPYCLATSSSPERCGRSLAVTGLESYFAGRIFTASMVRRGKPAPDLFLHAAAVMDHPPERCLVIEDSLPGIEAALAAGMHVLRFTGGVHLRGRTLKHPASVTTFDTWDAFPLLVEEMSKELR